MLSDAIASWKRGRKCLRVDPEQVIYKQACLSALIELEKQGPRDVCYGDEY